MTVALQIKNLPTGVGDDFKIEGSWSLGASKYVLGTSAPLGGSFYMFGNGPTGSAGKLAIGALPKISDPIKTMTSPTSQRAA